MSIGKPKSDAKTLPWEMKALRKSEPTADQLDISGPTNVPLVDGVCLKAERFSTAMMAMTSMQTSDSNRPGSSSNQHNNLRLSGLPTRLRPRSEEPQPSNQTIDPESINPQSESTNVSIPSSQQMTVVNLQQSSSSSLPVSLRLPLSPTTSPRPTPKPKSTNTTKPTAIRPHTPDLTNSRPESPSQINLANLIHHHPSQPLRSTYPPSQTTHKAVLTVLSTRIRDVPCTINPRIESGVPLPNHNLPQRTVIIQALPPSEHPESNRSNTPGEIWIGAMFRPAIVHLKCLPLIRLAWLSKLVHQKITILIGDLTKERDRAYAKAQKSRGSKTNEMVRIIKDQALKFEEERHWLTSKLVKLTSSNQVLERGRM
ncbi:hypothetical protein PPACK8108_LOCUS972 [Phakopsora pachyrhizi]|uniref:Uncharacterized protein n=1 Tax=Phakopsora pachyrhizi TaxID=170000 RepID=A0AAV0AF98_PHAPC|nr:hypothetical protein PPACK8108_LOCUS972 [Phakopsora pachyrhizi]